MRIDRLALKNFKCFKEVDVSFSKITLLTGENSSGKSSLIYGLLAPFQSVNWLGNSFPLYISLNGRYVNMGGFEEVSFNHNVNNILGIDLDCYIGNQKCSFTTDWQFQVKSKSPILYHLKLLDNSEQIEIRYTENANYIASFKFTNIRIPEISDLVIENIDDVRIDKIGDITKERDDTYPIFDMLNDLSNSLECDFNFISSFRLHPERTYYQTLLEDKIDRFGNGYIDQILVWSDNQSERLLKLASILKSLKILYDIKPYRLSGGRFEIKVKRRFKLEMQRVLINQRILRVGYDSQEIFLVCDL
jgi:AAA15 family ATPase/GTPase